MYLGKRAIICPGLKRSFRRPRAIKVKQTFAVAVMVVVIVAVVFGNFYVYRPFSFESVIGAYKLSIIVVEDPVAFTVGVLIVTGHQVLVLFSLGVNKHALHDG